MAGLEDYKERLRGFLPDYLGQKGINPRRPFRCLNPSHEDKDPSMSYNPKNQTVHCFGCGVTYDLLDLIGMDYHLNRFPEQLRRGCELFHLPWLPPEPAPAAVSAPPQDFTAQMEEWRKQSEGIAYFLARGIPEELCKAKRLFTYKGRAYLPVYEGERCISWCARALEGTEGPRYKNSPGTMGLYNGALLQNPPAVLFVCEGILDALSIEAVGFSALALCGAGNVPKLARLCTEHATAVSSVRFIVVGDGDAAGRRMNEAVVHALRGLHLACRPLELEEGRDLNDLLLADRENLRERLAQAADADREEYLRTSAAQELGRFFELLEQRSHTEAISTGFTRLDEILDGGFYSGLYVLGAISSLGKTSFLLQIADYISAQQRDVLFFSLEMSKFELMAKSLSRVSRRLDDTPGSAVALTARQILRGSERLQPAQAELLGAACQRYRQEGAGLYIREGIADIGTGEMREAVREHIALTGVRPVVVLDYLQILRPADARATDKQNIDRSVVELKRLSRDFQLPVVAISSFNRDNYRNAVSMEAFKESGAVEYSSDVLLGLQLAGAGEGPQDINAEKSKTPRSLELVMLKNRNGIPYAKLRYEYDARFSLFTELPERGRR